MLRAGILPGAFHLIFDMAHWRHGCPDKDPLMPSTLELIADIANLIAVLPVSYTHLTLPTTPYV